MLGSDVVLVCFGISDSTLGCLCDSWFGTDLVQLGILSGKTVSFGGKWGSGIKLKVEKERTILPHRKTKLTAVPLNCATNLDWNNAERRDTPLERALQILHSCMLEPRVENASSAGCFARVSAHKQLRLMF